MSTFPNWISWSVGGHVLGGIVALLTFSIPLISAKGGKLHVRSGWAYVFGMGVVCLSAFIVTPWRYFADPGRTAETQSFALFLGFLAVFALTCVQQCIIVFRHKGRVAPIKTLETLGLPAALLLAGAGTVAYGLANSNWLFVIFAGFGLNSTFSQIRFWFSPVRHSQAGRIFHLENMIVASIATVTAFLVTAVPRILPGAPVHSVWVWLLPTFVLVPTMITFKTKYSR